MVKGTLSRQGYCTYGGNDDHLRIFIYVLQHSIYDPAWCYFPIGMCIGWMSYAGFNVNFRGMAALILIVLWCVRYAVQFPWTGWFTGIEHEDWRYIEMAKRTGSNTVLYWIASLFLCT